ncbi:MAG: hypothetical protein L0H26_00015 [Microlunatus sp.]|nr:hypothetical protein [Microlunatus sp.]
MSPIPSRRAHFSVQQLLLGLGALLLSVAAITFLAFSWSVLGLTGRALVLAGITVAVIAGAGLARQRSLGATAESLGALAGVLVLLDAVAIRATGLAGDTVHPALYLAIASAVCAGMLGWLGARLRLRTQTVPAAALAWASPALLGLWVALTFSDLLIVGIGGGLGVAALMSLAAGPLKRRGYRAEGVVLLGLGITGWGVAFFTALTGTDQAGRSGLVLLALAGVVGAHAVWGEQSRRFPAEVLLGLTLGVATIELCLWAFEPRWILLPVVLIGTVGVLALLAAHRRPIAVGAMIVPAAATAVAGLFSGWQSLTALVAGFRPWTGSSTVAFESVLDPFGAEAASVALPGAIRLQILLALLIAAVGCVVVARFLRRDSGTDRWRRPAETAIGPLVGLTILGLPWQPELPLWAVVLGALGLGAGLIALRRFAGIFVWFGSVLFTLGIVAAWHVDVFSVPATAVGITALVLARVKAEPHRVAVSYGLLSVAASVAAISVLIAAFRLADVPVTLAWWLGLLLGASGMIVISCLASVRRAERWILVASGATAFGLAWLGVDSAWRWLATSIAMLACLALMFDDPQRVWPRAVPRATATGLVLVSASVAAAANQSVAQQVSSYGIPVGLILTLVAAGTLFIVASMLYRVGTDEDLVLPLQAGAAIVGVAALLAMVGEDLLWLTLLIQAASVAVLALVTGRSRYGWLALGLGSAALWLRLIAHDIGLVEWFTLPPALVMIGVGLWTLRRDLARHPGHAEPGHARVIRPSLVAGAATLVLPTAAIASDGPIWRPLACLVAATVALVGVRALGSSDAVASRTRHEAATLLTVAARGTLLLGPALRALLDAVRRDASVVELWSVPTAALLVLAIAVAAPWSGAQGAGAERHGLGRRPRWAPTRLETLLVLLVPSLVAAARGSYPDARVLVAQAVVGLVLAVGVAGTDRARSIVNEPIDMVPLSPVCWTVLGLTLAFGFLPHAGPIDLFWVSAGVTGAGIGVLRMRQDTDASSWRILGPALAVGLVPTLMLASSVGDGSRIVLLAVGATAVLVTGAVLRWQSPLLIGGGVVAIHAVVQLAPWISLVFNATPRWVTLGALGLGLLALGIRYEQRVRDLLGVQRRIASFR